MFPYDGYLRLAKKLAVVDDESCMRSAVSRSYYASLHRSIKLAESNGVRFQCKGKSEIHGEVLDYFKYHNSTVLCFVGVKLGRLRKNRNECDYNDDVKNIKKIAANAIIDAEEIFNDISQTPRA